MFSLPQSRGYEVAHNNVERAAGVSFTSLESQLSRKALVTVVLVGNLYGTAGSGRGAGADWSVFLARWCWFSPGRDAGSPLVDLEGQVGHGWSRGDRGGGRW